MPILKQINIKMYAYKFIPRHYFHDTHVTLSKRQVRHVENPLEHVAFNCHIYITTINSYCSVHIYNGIMLFVVIRKRRPRRTDNGVCNPHSERILRTYNTTGNWRYYHKGDTCNRGGAKRRAGWRFPKILASPASAPTQYFDLDLMSECLELRASCAGKQIC